MKLAGKPKNVARKNDVMRWTSVMAVIDNRVLFAVRDGHGCEWDDVGVSDSWARMVPHLLFAYAMESISVSWISVDFNFAVTETCMLGEHKQ